MDDELKQLAALQLRNAFYLNFSTLVRKYLDAAEGLDIHREVFKEQLGELTNVYSICTNGPSPYLGVPQITTDDSIDNHATIADALCRPRATCVYINRQVVFKRNPAGEWILISIG